MVLISKADFSESVSQDGINPAEVVIDQPLFSQPLVKMNNNELENVLSFSSSQFLEVKLTLYNVKNIL